MRPCRQQCRDIDRFPLRLESGASSRLATARLQAIQRAAHARRASIDEPGLRRSRQPAPAAPGGSSWALEKIPARLPCGCRRRPPGCHGASRRQARPAAPVAREKIKTFGVAYRRIRGLRKVRWPPSVPARSLASGYNRPSGKRCPRHLSKTRPGRRLHNHGDVKRCVHRSNPREIQRQESAVGRPDHGRLGPYRHTRGRVWRCNRPGVFHGRRRWWRFALIHPTSGLLLRKNAI